jgi:hypothetical protein
MSHLLGCDGMSLPTFRTNKKEDECSTSFCQSRRRHISDDSDLTALPSYTSLKCVEVWTWRNLLERGRTICLLFGSVNIISVPIYTLHFYNIFRPFGHHQVLHALLNDLLFHNVYTWMYFVSAISILIQCPCSLLVLILTCLSIKLFKY